MWAGAWRGGNAHAPTAARPRGHVQRPRTPGTLNASGVVGASWGWGAATAVGASWGWGAATA